AGETNENPGGETNERCETICHECSSTSKVLERQRLIHPIIAAKNLLAVESGQALGAGLGHADDGIGAEGSPHFAGDGGMAEEKLVVGAGEKLGAAGIALSRSAAEKLEVDAMARRRL